MAEQHPAPEALRRFAVGEVSTVEAAEIERHLVVCTECRGRVDEAVDLLSLPFFDGLGRSYDAAFDRAVLGAAEQLVALRREARGAEDLLAELLREPAAVRQRKIRDDERFHSLKLCELLRARSKGSWLSHPAAALIWAELATGIAEHLDPRRYGRMLVEDTRSLCWAYLANSLRVMSDLRRAERAVSLAWSHCRQGSGDFYTEAELLTLTTSLRRDQERFDEAVKLADRAAALYRSAHETDREGATLIEKGVALGADRRYRDAITAIRSGLSRIDPAKDPRLLFIGKHNLSVYLLEDGRQVEAAQILEELRPLHREITDMALRAHFHWLQGHWAECLGQLSTAESRLGEAREVFLEQGLGAPVFEVSLALAEVHARAGRPRRAREILGEVIPLGEAVGPRRQLLAARLLYEQVSRASR